MTSQLDALRDMTVVVADTGDIDAVRRLKPTDCTTNPSIVLKAMQMAEFADTIDTAVTWGKTQPGDAEARLTAVADRLATAVGVTLAGLVPGRISTEVDASMSFDTAGSVIRARAIIADYAAMGVDRARVLVKLAATWEGIRAAEIHLLWAGSLTGTRNPPASPIPRKPIRACCRCARFTIITNPTASRSS